MEQGNLHNAMDTGLLISKAIREKLTAEEEQKLQAWLDEKEENRQLYHKLLKEATDPATAAQWLDVNREVALQRIKQQLDTGYEAKPHRITRYRNLRIAVAAAVILLAASGLYLWVIKPTAPADAPRQAADTHDLPPGGNIATLTLGNGSVIVLDKQSNGKLASQGNTTILKPDSGRLVYNAQGNTQKVLYNTITTPRGGQYQVTLPDGSRVWLNAASSLRFPTAFRGNQRKVILTGEAYFEIAPRIARPFIVTVNNMQVTELGTRFNIMAYDGEPVVKTTLIDGAVKVSEGAFSIILKPGEQAQAGIHIKGIQVKAADTAEALAWKNGLFRFDNATIQDMMRQISRWYDADVVFKGRIPVERYRGEAPRNLMLSQLLKIMEISGVHISIEGRKIIVSP